MYQFLRMILNFYHMCDGLVVKPDSSQLVLIAGRQFWDIIAIRLESIMYQFLRMILHFYHYLAAIFDSWQLFLGYYLDQAQKYHVPIPTYNFKFLSLQLAAIVLIAGIQFWDITKISLKSIMYQFLHCFSNFYHCSSQLQF